MQPYRSSLIPNTLYLATVGHVCCLDRSNGKILWDRPLGLKGYPTLLCAPGVLFATGDGYVACLAEQDGRILWHTYIGISSPASISLDQSCSRLFIACAGMVFALVSQSGDLIWNNELKGMGYHHVSMRVPDTISAQPTWSASASGDSHETLILEDDQKKS